MKILRAILNAGAALLLVSTAICGLWLRGQGAAVDPSSISFHMTIGLLGVAVWLLALGVGGFVRPARPRSLAEGAGVRSSSSSKAVSGER